MKAVILAGGLGTRLSEETVTRPKPMVEIGGKPILWHILKIYSSFGINEFVVCLGYKGYVIKEYFSNYFLHMSDVTLDMSSNSMDVHSKRVEPWRVTLVDTGEKTMTGGRIKRISEYLSGEEDFCLTYGDGVADVDIENSIKFHRAHGKLATMTTSYPLARFGAVEVEGSRVDSFKEKPRGDGNMINAGFFVLKPEVLDYIDGDDIRWESEPLSKLANDRQLMAFEHTGFWQPMDTLRDKEHLENLWQQESPPWKVWA